MNHRTKQRRLWIWILAAVLVLAVSGFAVQRSVSIRTSWKVLPYQTLQLSDSRDAVTAVNFEFPEPTPLDTSRGYIETEHAVRLHVVSNTPWKIQVWVRNRADDDSPALQVRRQGGNYLDLSNQPQVLALGQNGVFEISVDYRLPAGSDGAFSTQATEEVVYTIMSD